MLTALTIAHIVISLILILMVLIQDSKGDASGLLGGSGGQSLFGATGATSFIVKATRTMAALFALCCIGLAYLTSNQANTSGVFDRVATPPPASSTNSALETEVPATPVEASTEAPAAAKTEEAVKPADVKKTDTPASTQPKTN
jgi:preprotein translocase subunit SecG